MRACEVTYLVVDPCLRLPSIVYLVCETNEWMPSTLFLCYGLRSLAVNVTLLSFCLLLSYSSERVGSNFVKRNAVNSSVEYGVDAVIDRDRFLHREVFGCYQELIRSTEGTFDCWERYFASMSLVW